MEHKMCILFSSKFFSETFLILRRKVRVIIIQMYIGIHAKCLLLLSVFNETSNFSANLLKILKYQVS